MLYEALKYAKEMTFTPRNLVAWVLLQFLFYVIKWPSHNPTVSNSICIIIFTYILLFITLVIWSVLKSAFRK